MVSQPWVRKRRGDQRPSDPRLSPRPRHGVARCVRRDQQSLGHADGSERQGPRAPSFAPWPPSATMARDLATRYGALCERWLAETEDPTRRARALRDGRNLSRVPWEPAQSFWEAVQSLWLTHMLVMSDENYPGPGLSFGRMDQYLLPYWESRSSKGWTASGARKSSNASGSTAIRHMTP